MTRPTWQDLPSTATPLSAAMLNDLEARKPELDEQMLNAMSYPGALPGDRLAAAIADLPSTGAALFIPRGKYVGAFDISNKDHLTIIGEGSSTVIHNTTASQDALTITDCLDLEARNIRVQGTSGTQDGLSLVRCHRANIGNIYCGGTGRHGIRAEECLGIAVDPCYVGSALTPGPYPTGLVPVESCLVLTWDTVNADSGCNGFVINGGFYISGQSQSWAVDIDHSELGVINSPVPELSGGGLRLRTCMNVVVNGYYGEANPSDIEYAAGTASVTNASTAVTGASTAWATNDAQGRPNAWANKFLFRDTGSVVNWQRILTAPTDTTITLASNWLGPTEAGVAYRIQSIDLLLDTCLNCNVTTGRGGAAVALTASKRNKIVTITESIFLDATSHDNEVDITTNRASGTTSPSRVVNRGARNTIKTVNYQTAVEEISGTGARFGDVSPEWFVEAAVMARHTGGYAFATGGGVVQWPAFVIGNSGALEWGGGGGSGLDCGIARTKAATVSVFSGDLAVDTAGKGLQVKEGSNAKMGASTLVAGTVTVSTTAVTATSRILLTGQNSSGTHGELTVSARTAGTSFTITSANGADTRSVAWFIVEPT